MPSTANDRVASCPFTVISRSMMSAFIGKVEKVNWVLLEIYMLLVRSATLKRTPAPKAL